MALSTARMHKVRGRPPRLAAGISSLSHSHSSSVRSLGYVFSFIFSFYTTHEDFSDRLLENARILLANLFQGSRSTLSRVSFPSVFAFQAGMWGTPISTLLNSPTVSA